VPQTSLAAELREEAGAVEADELDEDFTAERAASSLGGFQRGTLRARDEAAEESDDRDGTAVPEEPAPRRSASDVAGPADDPHGREETAVSGEPGAPLSRPGAGSASDEPFGQPEPGAVEGPDDPASGPGVPRAPREPVAVPDPVADSHSADR
jgi:hypothetical protein